MKKYTLIFLTLTALLLSSCAPAAMETAAPEMVSEGMVGAAPAYQSADLDYDMAAEESAGSIASNTNQAAVQRIVIKNAELSIVVDDPAAAMKYIVNLAESQGGFVVNSYLYKTYTANGIEVPAANITVRVPSENLTKSLDNIKALVKDGNTDILNETVSGEDVTREYTDLQSRLRNLENAADQLEKIMDEAYKTEEVLKVYNRLVEVQEEIEVLKGQIKYYDEASRLSSIAVKIQAQESVQPLTIGKWQPKGIARDALQALLNALKFIASALIWIVIYVIPVLAIIFVPIWLVVRFFIRRSKKRKALKPVQEETKAKE
ncbi:MAG: DUF4349 domain-containing protein [Anaerolineaceae bacterium]|jgi:osmotically-inducible protein OsmY|nr:DUF4349 domain-containing protein [Anaerolineaceae bacterium]